MPTASENVGTVEAVRGSVVDVAFPEHVPLLYHVLRTGGHDEIVIEVMAHLDAHTVRGIALTSTRGLSRGTVVNALVKHSKCRWAKGF
jgi:F-type H+-transporting ATPase subunit beta